MAHTDPWVGEGNNINAVRLEGQKVFGFETTELEPVTSLGSEFRSRPYALQVGGSPYQKMNRGLKGALVVTGLGFRDCF